MFKLSSELIRFPVGLYGITPDWDDTQRLLAAVRLAAKGGMKTLQLRRKQTSLSKQLEQAQALQIICRELEIVFIINDNWQLALDIQADGVHLGKQDQAAQSVRAVAGSKFLIGVSCYNDLSRVREALTTDIDYVALGAVYPSSTKPDALTIPLTRLEQARSLIHTFAVPRPALVAIGGITPCNARPVVEAGADAVAVISGLFETCDIAASAHQYQTYFQP